MTIDELLEHIIPIRKQYGNITVEVKNSAGDLTDAEAVIIHEAHKNSGQKWKVIIDA